jgi:hypothetical protein
MPPDLGEGEDHEDQGFLQLAFACLNAGPADLRISVQ